MKIVSFQMVEVCSELNTVSSKATGSNTYRSLCPGNLRDFNFRLSTCFIFTAAFVKNMSLAEPHPSDLEGWR
jgi:hypothetical protein